MKIKLTLPKNIIREYPAGTTLLEVSRDFAANYQSPIVEGISMALALICKSLFLKMVQLIL